MGYTYLIQAPFSLAQPDSLALCKTYARVSFRCMLTISLIILCLLYSIVRMLLSMLFFPWCFTSGLLFCRIHTKRSISLWTSTRYAQFSILYTSCCIVFFFWMLFSYYLKSNLFGHQAVVLLWTCEMILPVSAPWALAFFYMIRASLHSVSRHINCRSLYEYLCLQNYEFKLVWNVMDLL